MHRSAADDRLDVHGRAALAARRADQPAAVGDRARRGFRRADRELPGPPRRSFGCSAIRPRRWPSSRSAPCSARGPHAHTRTPVAHYLPVALIKLIVHPALVFGLGSAAMRSARGIAVRPHGAHPVAALPSASNVSLLAERYGADNGRIARIIMASTVLSFATFSRWPGSSASANSALSIAQRSCRRWRSRFIDRAGSRPTSDSKRAPSG